MTAPPIKDTTGRPATELVGTTADSPIFTGSGTGLCVIGAEWGSGSDAATVIDGEYGDLASVPYQLFLERWQLLAYDESGDPIAIDAVVDVLTADYDTNTFASIAGSDLPTLAAASKNESLALTGWTLEQPVDTMYRFVLVSHSGSPGKIVLGIRAFAP